MRIEVARSFAEALSALSEMGLELSTRESLSRQVAEIFRGAQRNQTKRGRP
jgi:transcription initiation factor TFIIIB Brf1 subunit/transcription initiation factor TFIIB